MSPPRPLDISLDNSDVSRSSTRNLRQSPQRQAYSRSPTRNDQQGSAGNPGLSYSSYQDLEGSSPSGMKRPPPINRASKPVTPTILGFNLGISTTGNGDRDKVSPFSTPPSSPTREERSHVNTREDMFDDDGSYIVHATSGQATKAQNETAVRKEQNMAAMQANRTSTVDLNAPSSRRSFLANRTEPMVPISAPARSYINQTVFTIAPLQPPRPAQGTKAILPMFSKESIPRSSSPEGLLPPPKRNLIPSSSANTSRESLPFTIPPGPIQTNSGAPALPTRTRRDAVRKIDDEAIATPIPIAVAPHLGPPDNSQSNRRPPRTKCNASRVWTQYDARSMDLCGNYVCVGGHNFRAWDITNSRTISDYTPEPKESRITSFVFKPGNKSGEEEGTFVWIGSNAGEIREINLNLKLDSVIEIRSDAHGKREIIKMFRYQNSLWSLDEEGKLLIWPPGADGVPSLKLTPNVVRVARGHSCSIVVKSHLWIASNRNIHVYDPMGGEGRLNITLQPLSQASAADITSAAVISSQLDRVYFGHSDGKISMYSTEDFTCLGLISASAYKINCLAGVGVYLWAGFNTGMIHVYDTHSEPWMIKKEWQAHQKNPISSIMVDSSSVWKFGHLQVASLGADNAICFWDGLLEDDWIGKHHQCLLILRIG